MSAGQRQMRAKQDTQSHFEQSLQELNAVKRGTVGRSANVQELLAGNAPHYPTIIRNQ